MSHSKLVRWYRTVARIAAWIAGADPLDVWPSYGTFEADSSILFDTAEDFYNSVKWILEERERAREQSSATAQAASLVVGTSVPESVLAEGDSVQVDDDRGLLVEKRIHDLNHEE